MLQAAKVAGSLRLKEIAEGGTSTSMLCYDVKQLWNRETSHGPCPESLPFSLTLPSTFSDGKTKYPLCAYTLLILRGY